MRKLFNNTVFTSIDHAVMIGLSVLATPVLITNLGVEGYGVFVFLSIFSFYGALSVFDFGMGGSIVTYVAKADVGDDHHTIQGLLSIGLVFYAVMGALLGTVLYFSGGFIAARFIDEKGVLDLAVVNRSVTIISINLAIQFLTLPMNSTLEGLRRFVLSKSINSILLVPQYLFLMITAIYWHRVDIAFGVILTITVIRLLVYIFIFVFRLPQFRRMQLGLDLSLLRRLFGYSSILFINRIIGVIFNQIDKFLIWLFLAVSSLTVYDIVVKPASVIRLVLTVLNSAVVPETARLHHLKDYATIRKLYINLVRYAYLILLPVLALLAVHIHELIALWVGRELAVHSYLVLILLSSYTLSPIPSVASTMVIGLEMVRKTIWISIVATVINAGLSIGLVKSYGLVGLLCATLSAQVFTVFPYLYMMMRFLDMRFSQMARPVLRLLASSVPFFAVHLLLRNLFSENTGLLLGTACAVVLVNLFFNYRFHLGDDEREQLTDRINAYKARLIPGVFAR